jgi:hypothetical protein
MPDLREDCSRPYQPTTIRHLVVTTTPHHPAAVSTSTAGPSMPIPHRPLSNIASPQLVPHSSLTIVDFDTDEDDYRYYIYEDYNWEAT